jgi:hypothetical protein
MQQMITKPIEPPPAPRHCLVQIGCTSAAEREQLLRYP